MTFCGLLHPTRCGRRARICYADAARRVMEFTRPQPPHDERG
jgi:hypothetical protein